MNGNNFPIYRACGIFGWLCLPWSWGSAALLCKPEGQGTVAFRSVPSCDRQKEEGFSFPFPLPSFRIPQPCKPAPEHSPLLCMAIPSPRTEWEVLKSTKETLKGPPALWDDVPASGLTLLRSFITFLQRGVPGRDEIGWDDLKCHFQTKQFCGSKMILMVLRWSSSLFLYKAY